jgi:2-polyprenyl-6-methoxyphenol hydroxylase-like FAD-dependent oxidoreductase
MDHREKDEPTPSEPTARRSRYGEEVRPKRRQRGHAQRHDHDGLQELYLTRQERATGDRRLGAESVARWSTLDHIDHGELALQEAETLDELVEALPGRSHERKARPVFRRPGSFPDEQHAREKTAPVNHDVLAKVAEGAPTAPFDLPVEAAPLRERPTTGPRDCGPGLFDRRQAGHRPA